MTAQETRSEVPSTMKGVRLHSPGGLDHLSYEEMETPTPSPGEALVRVHAAAITRDELGWPLDRLPAIPSYELSGVVVEVEDGMTGLGVGQPVLALTGFDRDGVAAEYAAVPIAYLARKPQGLTHTEAAALPLPALSAMQGLFDHGRLQENERVLIHGAAGGVGAYAVQLARRRGAYVIATTSAERAETARLLGADEVIDHTATDFTEAVGGVDLVFDTAGGDRLARSIPVLGDGGRLVSVAESPPEGMGAERGIECTFFIVEPSREQLEELALLVDQGELRVLIDRVYPLEEARRAFERTMDRTGRGKVVLSVIDDESAHAEDGR